ncbi:response regulator [Desulfococcaceae bacterium HSG8]|nr:response regulator [Desulfococcaceae bacterium HSG8]
MAETDIELTNESQPSILIVDDNIKNLNLLTNLLIDKGYNIGISKNGFMALEFIRKRNPDLILLDIMMPDIDGLEVCRQLKSDKKTKDIPVIFISGLADTADKLRGFKAGGVDYITKPFEKEEVFARVNTHLELIRSHKDIKKAKQALETANRSLEDRGSGRTEETPETAGYPYSKV